MSFSCDHIALGFALVRCFLGLKAHERLTTYTCRNMLVKKRLDVHVPLYTAGLERWLVNEHRAVGELRILSSIQSLPTISSYKL
jgi:hypothetical protein